MAEPYVPDEVQSQPPPPGKNWAFRACVWAIVGAAVGSLWSLFHYGSEDGLEAVAVPVLAFALVGVILSLLIDKGCMT